MVNSMAAIQNSPAIPIVKKFLNLNPKCRRKGPENIKNSAIAMYFMPFDNTSLFVLIIMKCCGVTN